MIQFIDHLPKSVKISSDIAVWGISVTGWLSLIQPWLTAIATILAMTWTGIQLYNYFNKK